MIRSYLELVKLIDRLEAKIWLEDPAIAVCHINDLFRSLIERLKFEMVLDLVDCVLHLVDIFLQARHIDM